MIEGIYLGSCIDYMRTLKNETIDLCVTDPPYKLTSGGKNGKGSEIWGGCFKRSEYDNSGILFEIPKPIDWMKELYRVMKQSTHFYCFINDKNLGDFLSAGLESGFKLHNILVMRKDTHTPNRWYLKNAEYILFFKKGKAKNINNMGTKTVIDVKMPKNKVHPSQKPIKIYDILINNSSKENELVFDPFLGSGTAYFSARKNKRRFIGCEISDKYFDIMTDRIINEVSDLFGNSGHV